MCKEISVTYLRCNHTEPFLDRCMFSFTPKASICSKTKDDYLQTRPYIFSNVKGDEEHEL